MSEAPKIDRPLHIESAPETVRNEQRWQARNAEGEAVVLAQLLPHLANDESLRRRYVYEAERLAKVESTALAAVLAIGPTPDPKDPTAEPPWRLRVDPPGTRLDRWLRDRAPVPVDEAVQLLGNLATAVHAINQAGLVLRDLEPRSIVISDDGSVVITDVGLARMDILSSRTASSLMLESSAYAAPEHLRATVVDARADVYTLAAIAWEALTGVLPYDEGSPFVRDYAALPPLAELRQGVPAGLDELLRSCLREDPDLRPSGADDLINILEGHASPSGHAIERVPCQACGVPLRAGLRLCLSCGRTAVQYNKASEGPGYSIALQKAKEDREFHAKLERFFSEVAEGPVPELNFLIGDQRMYSKSERKVRTHLPTSLLDGLDKESGKALVKRLKAEGLAVKLQKGKVKSKRKRIGNVLMLTGGALAATMVGAGLLASAWPLTFIGVLFGALLIPTGAVIRYRARLDNAESLAELRAAPAALPASDPLVARLAALLSDELAPDLGEQVSELALLVQRLCDHRSQVSDDSGTIDMLLEPLGHAVALICDEIEAIRDIDTDLKPLDESYIIRAIAASEARKEERSRRSELLAGLDKLRDLEDRRSTHMGGLLQAAALLRRAVQLGLSSTNTRLLESNRITIALAALGSSSSSE